MKRTKALGGLQVFLKQCESQSQATREHKGTIAARALIAGVRVPRVRRKICCVLVLELIEGTSLAREVSEELVGQALHLLATIHSTEIPESFINHYHGESLYNRLRDELKIVDTRRDWLGIEPEVVAILARAVQSPILSFVELDAAPKVLGHGDYQASNLMNAGETIVPVDWVDFGACDPRYEWAHFLDSLDGVFDGQSGIECFSDLARETLCPECDKDVFARNLLVGEIVDRIVRAGNKARNAVEHQDNGKLAAGLRGHVARLEQLLDELG